MYCVAWGGTVAGDDDGDCYASVWYEFSVAECYEPGWSICDWRSRRGGGPRPGVVVLGWSDDAGECVLACPVYSDLYW